MQKQQKTILNNLLYPEQSGPKPKLSKDKSILIVLTLRVIANSFGPTVTRGKFLQLGQNLLSFPLIHFNSKPQTFPTVPLYFGPLRMHKIQSVRRVQFFFEQNFYCHVGEIQ